ncbi:Uma2 family endonuclease [Cyanobacterium stanieri LEGE 03274]|uniref:Uma2 family endonuclease n=1 Tax=Cyanobacterium stanieri LEGE 03274 TaxID=1828756 RepID=A0ABR9V7A9_9CHRO|nr:Uma2 family endonuclease [Cyanobacterium stanieri]MBE9222996.1 Uma2 family endonuclease [Cyanobacterium stanieri LEGE 03274]
MVQSLGKTYSFDEYLTFSDGTDSKYELVNGELILMPTAIGFHALILHFIFKLFEKEIERLKLDFKVMPGTVGVRTAENKSRIPDLTILSSQQCQEIRQMKTAVLNSAPILAVEIVSANNKQDDYRYKRSEYAVREIPEYWIIDPELERVSILILIDGFYEVTEYQKNDLIKSTLFPELTVKAQDFFAL